jgi:hypothetical protein
VAAALGVAVVGSSASAQYNNVPTSTQSIQRRDIGSGYSVGSLNSISLRQGQGYLGNSLNTLRRPTGPSDLGLSRGPVAKPFSSYSPAPTVSPYLNLFREDFDGESDLNYQTLVRPMLQQQQFNEQVQRQALETGKRLQSLSAKSDFNMQGSENMMPTGHKTVFNYTSHFYPQPRQQR